MLPNFIRHLFQLNAAVGGLFFEGDGALKLVGEQSVRRFEVGAQLPWGTKVPPSTGSITAFFSRMQMEPCGP
jgi:hypothetical protein